MHSFSELAALFDTRIRSGNFFPDTPAQLYEPCAYTIANGGKRVRPVLCLMAAEAFGDISEDAWQAAFAVELFHNFTLLHDDIMDKAQIRRGQPAVYIRNGLAAGILSGDVMSILAYDHLSRINAAVLPVVLRLFNRTAIEVCEGQQHDMDFEQRTDVRVEEYISMIRQKTAVLLACSLKMGALVAGATESAATRLYDAGLALGIAFQLQDDFLDAFGDGSATGKTVGGDIAAGKKTYLSLRTLELSAIADKERILGMMSGGESNIEEMTRCYVQTGAADECRAAVAHYSGKAFEALDDLPVMAKRKAPIKELAVMLLNRQH
jgi:geranylgeranyl diphosphate synthase type II